MAVIIIAAAVMGVYFKILDAPFLYDDHNTILSSPHLLTFRPISKFVATNRPLTNLSYALSHEMGGGTTQAYHRFDVLLHCVNALLVCILTLRILQHLPASPYRWAAPMIATATALFFAVHPLQTQVVAYISSRSESLAGCFYLMAVLLYDIAATGSTRTGRGIAAVGLPLCVTAALASKEFAVTIPIALALFDVCFLRHRADLRWRLTLLGISIVPFAVALLSLTRMALTGNSAGFSFERVKSWEYFLTQFGVIVHYLRLAIFPVGLTIDYDWPLARSFWQPGVFIPFFVLCGLALAAFAQIRRRPLASFGLLWVFVVLAPTSSIMPIADLVAERRMYLPVFGLTLCAAKLLWDASGSLVGGARQPPRACATVYAIIVALLAATLSAAALARVAIWSDPVELYRDGVAKAPTNPRVRLNLGASYLSRGQYDEAHAQLVQALRLYERGESLHAFPRVGALIHYNLGAVFYARGAYDQAEVAIKRGLELGGQYQLLRPMSFFVLGSIAAVEGRADEAIERYQEALRSEPRTPYRVQMQQLLARQYVKVGRPDLAVTILQEALRLAPDDLRTRKMVEQLQRSTP